MPLVSVVHSFHTNLTDYIWWHYRRYGVRALAAQGRTDEAIRYAERSLGLNDSSSDMARACEEILLAAGRNEEAYRRFGYAASRAGSHLATFRAIRKRRTGRSRYNSAPQAQWLK